jgi:HEAT repeat protein
MRTFVVVVLALFTSVATAQPAKAPIADVIAKLSDNDPKVRSQAAWSLGRHYADDPARLDPLEKVASSDPVAVVRSNALGALDPKDIGKSPRWTKLFLKILTTDSEPEVRVLAAMRLTPAEPATFDAMIAALDKETAPRVRNQILDALVAGKAPKLTDLLVKIVETHPDPGGAVGLLAGSGDPRAIPALKAAALRADPKYSNSALKALIETKDPAVDDIVLEFIDDKKWAMQTIRFLVSAKRIDPRQTPKLAKVWQSQSKAVRKRSVSKLKAHDAMEDDHDIHHLTDQLRAIAAKDQSPCEARTAAKKGELKAYLAKILPKECGKE